MRLTTMLPSPGLKRTVGFEVHYRWTERKILGSMTFRYYQTIETHKYTDAIFFNSATTFHCESPFVWDFNMNVDKAYIYSIRYTYSAYIALHSYHSATL